MAVAQLKLPTRPFPIPEEMVLVCETFGFQLPRTSGEIGYTLTRRKEGTEIGLQQDGHWWNLSHLTGVYPPSFNEARKWIANYAAQRGQTAHELEWDRDLFTYVRKD